MDAWEKLYIGRRGGGRVCPCCAETAPKGDRKNHGAIRRRLAAETRREIAREIASDND